MTDREDLGTLVQRCALPSGAGMDALEARIVGVQEVPPKAELRFYAVYGDDRQRLSTHEATILLRAHVPQKPVTDLSDVELLVEVSALRTEAARMRPVYEAAKKWRYEAAKKWRAEHNCDAVADLYGAVDAAVASECDGESPITDDRKQELRFKVWDLARDVLTDTANTRATMPFLLDEEYAYARAFMLGIAKRTRPGQYRDDGVDESDDGGSP
jgi:hypothetical protein